MKSYSSSLTHHLTSFATDNWVSKANASGQVKTAIHSFIHSLYLLKDAAPFRHIVQTRACDTWIPILKASCCSPTAPPPLHALDNIQGLMKDDSIIAQLLWSLPKVIDSRLLSTWL